VRKIRVLIVDENPEVRRALGAVLGGSARIEVLGSAQSYTAGLTVAETLRPDIVMLEPKSRGKRPAAAPVDVMVRQLADRSAASIILTSYPLEEERESALRAGARRYLLKDINADRLISEIEAVAAELPAIPQDSPAPS
jgi:DNA-binding NarL/FixJ family response regulator